MAGINLIKEQFKNLLQLLKNIIDNGLNQINALYYHYYELLRKYDKDLETTPNLRLNSYILIGINDIFKKFKEFINHKKIRTNKYCKFRNNPF